MPINVDPIPTHATTTTVEDINADALHLEKVEIDASNPAAPTVKVVVRPYKIGEPNIYAAETWEMTTANVYQAAQRMPLIGAAIMSMFAAAKQWHEYEAAREADLVAARAELQTDVDAAQDLAQAAAQAEADRNLAFAAREDENDPAWLAADQAWQDAVVAAEQAATALATPEAKLKVALAALADPINPTVDEVGT